MDLPRKARRVAGNLRCWPACTPDDAGIAALVGRLAVASAEFAALWGDHRVEACATAVSALEHPRARL